MSLIQGLIRLICGDAQASPSGGASSSPPPSPPRAKTPIIDQIRAIGTEGGDPRAVIGKQMLFDRSQIRDNPAAFFAELRDHQPILNIGPFGWFPASVMSRKFCIGKRCLACLTCRT